MIITTFRIAVPEENAVGFEQKFSNRSKLVDQAPGFISFKLLKTKTTAGLEYILLTEWESREDHENWVRSRAHSKIHEAKTHNPLPGGITEVFEIICN
ncbi:MAG TPA: antibiotic biosynthesis monooxygenase [Bacillus bacterium]|nr:antibiotic biosynthesis monooxygenase [Bacillus sp. (in: firmicutes)]